MDAAGIIDKKIRNEAGGATVLGVDIGSRTGKAALLKGGALFVAQTPTGFDMQSTADELIEELFRDADAGWNDIDYAVGTGYGRVSLRFDAVPHEIVTEISCHAMGAHALNRETHTIIDIGGQDSKAIKVDPETGKVTEFVMNDKCAAGTGRFLEKVATLLELSIDELGQQAIQSEAPVDISSQCVVFAESEIISLRARGYETQDIAAGVHLATAKRVKTLLSRVGIVPGVFFSGGVSNNIGMRKTIEDQLGEKILPVQLDPIYAGALGAAVLASQLLKNKAADGGAHTGIPQETPANLSFLSSLIQARKQDLIHKKTAPVAGYLCSYTPLELLSAAGLSHLRLFQAGNTEEVASGEVITQSVFCDFTKGILGKFQLKDPLYSAVDKVYTFYTCDCIKKVSEAIGEFFTPTEIYVLPRVKDRPNSRDYYRQEILTFKADVEKLSGRKVDDSDLSKQIKLYNQVRKLLVKLSALRKRPNPPLSGDEFLELINGYYYLPPETLLPYYQAVYDRLSALPVPAQRPLRLMMSGGIAAEGDRRLIRLIEQGMGARVVVEDHCTGLKVAQTVIAETGDPYEALALGYIDQSPCSRMKPLEDRIEFSGGLAQEYDVDGVIYAYLKFCPCYGQIKNQFFRHYQSLNIPVLELPIDYSRSDEGQLKTRLEAFIEVLNESKRPQGEAV
ncbi:MAG: acyl-CoA dehydratase activase [Clostridiales Family XIII bacterium]|jgi:predicted CoA-substrate-specific enzyme activase|nr:acyl-CoA dehydratase activase [Clostridiales Family XIII bacterium]